MTSPQIYGLVGFPVKHSLSPLMHNAAFKALDIDAEYRLFEVAPDNLEDFLLKDIEIKDINGKSVRTADILGFNITLPHKVKAKEILERAFPFEEDAVQVQRDLFYVMLSGAVNTVTRENGKLGYFNTDAEGFLESLEKDLNFETKDKKVLVIGCGGAGRAVVAALSWRQQRIDEIYLTDINSEKVTYAKEHFNKFQKGRFNLEYIETEKIPEVIQKCDLLVNASPVGMNQEDGSVIDKKSLHKKLYIFDVVYNRETQLIKDAKSLGRPAVDGLGMLLYQGADAFGLWTGQKAPIEVMRKALREAINK